MDSGIASYPDKSSWDSGTRPEKCKETAGRSPLKNPARPAKKSKPSHRGKSAADAVRRKRFQKLVIIIIVTFLTIMNIDFKNLINPFK
jgi:hypothetical protein